MEGSQATKVGCREELLWISRFLVWLLTLRTLQKVPSAVSFQYPLTITQTDVLDHRLQRLPGFD